MVAKAVARGDRVVVQDARGRYASGGEFDPYKNEGADGFEMIEWIARSPVERPRCDRRAVTEARRSGPPLLKRRRPGVRVPRNVLLVARQFFYFRGAFDLSWLPWTANNIAPDHRRRKGVSGPATGRERAHVVARARTRRAAARAAALSTASRERHALRRRAARPSRRGADGDFAEIQRRHRAAAAPSSTSAGGMTKDTGRRGDVNSPACAPG